MAKALEAEAREALNRGADEAVYVRRNAAIEQERKIKENELQPNCSCKLKQRELRERGLEGEIALERQRAALTDQRQKTNAKSGQPRLRTQSGY